MLKATVPNAGNAGTVTSFSFTNANGIMGMVTDPTTAPNLTLALGAITPSTVNALTFTAAAVGFTIAGGTSPKTLTVDGDATISGSNSGDQITSGTTDRISVSNGSTNPVIDIAATYAGQSSITTLGTIASGTWQGTAIGAAYGGTGVANNAANTLTFSGNFGLTLTLSATTSLTLPTSGTVATLSNNLGQFASTTSAQLASVISDETGSGLLVFATSPTLTTPILGVASATSINKVAITAPATSATLTIADGKTLTATATLTFTGTDSTSFAFPAASSTVLTTGNGATLTSGFIQADYDAGTKSSGTFTPDPANGNLQRCVNGGAFTLAPPSNNTSLQLDITNNGSAGTVTTSGFTKVVGSAFTTTNTNAFRCFISVFNSKTLLNVVALQ